jgi:hypothetical protein
VKEIRCNWNSIWDINGEHRKDQTSLINKKIVVCTNNSSEGYICAISGAFPSGVISCASDQFSKDEIYFTGLDGLKCMNSNKKKLLLGF